MKIYKRSATRVDLAGGTLDCWPLYLLVDGCVTINLSISIFTHATLEPIDSPSIQIFMRDLGVQRQFANLDELLADSDESLKLIQVHAAFWRPQTGFSLETSSESPVGGGLGGSSSLSISMIKAFAEWLRADLSVSEMVTLSANLEAQVLHKMTGTQDYYPAIAPGLNAIHYSPKGANLESLASHQDFWNDHLTLVYTGHPHHSGLNNWQVIQAALNAEPKTLKALEDLREISWELYHVLKEQRLDRLPDIFNREVEARIRLSSSFSSPEILRLRNVALKSGAQAVKICGAGGGGCVFVWSQPEMKKNVEDQCRAQGFEVLNAKAVF